MAACKAGGKCPRLAVRELFFEPNPRTLSVWQAKNGFYASGIDRRVVFVCESPSEVRRYTPPEFVVGGVEGYRCWSGHNPKAVPFLEVRERFGLQNCLVTNAVKCGVPRPSTPSRLTEIEMKNCSSFLGRELESVRPEVVACVGGKARAIFERYSRRRLSFSPAIVQLTHYSFRGSSAERDRRWQAEFERVRGELRERSVSAERPVWIELEKGA